MNHKDDNFVETVNWSKPSPSECHELGGQNIVQLVCPVHVMEQLTELDSSLNPSSPSSFSIFWLFKLLCDILFEASGILLLPWDLLLRPGASRYPESFFALATGLLEINRGPAAPLLFANWLLLLLLFDFIDFIRLGPPFALPFAAAASFFRPLSLINLLLSDAAAPSASTAPGAGALTGLIATWSPEEQAGGASYS